MILNLINSLIDIHAVSPDAAKAYEKAKEKLVHQVNDDLDANPKILELIGDNPFDLMWNNHSNHATFMTTVFKIGSYELLARTIPWVYRAYRARGFSYDYFPVELVAWKHAVKECLDDVYSTEIIEIYDWMISHHENMIQLSVNGEGLTFSLQKETTEMQEVLLSLLLHGDSRGSLQLVNQSVKKIDDLKHFYLDVVCPVMYRIGLLWEKNVISVAEEHVATAIIGRITAALYPLFANVDMCRGKAVVTAGPNEFHEVGARMLADFLEMEGWDVTYLGANTPKEELLTILKRHKPFMVALSVATVFNLDHARQTIEMVKADPETRNIRIMVGGLAFNNMPQLWRDFGAEGYAADANKGALSANAWWERRIAA
ncbi:MAG: cobalamin-binding protein [Desulfobacteraceae bacterium]|nr:MAG: cobalamin-binding protein [Desulfobacteraceae bacterium]RPH47900.1 MAG: cobalamin-binding protein [Desulfobacteraceae bacterium]